MIKKSNNFEMARKYFLEGLEFFEKEMLDRAEDSFRNSLEIIPDRESTLSNLAALLVRRNKNIEARDICNKILEKNNSNILVWISLGAALTNLKQYELAVESYDKAIILNDSFAEAWSNRGMVLLKLKKYDQSLESLDKATSIKQDFAEAWSNRGSVLIELKQYQNAIDSLNKALLINPNLELAWLNLGHAFSLMEDYEKALEMLDRAIDIRTDLVSAWSGRGNVLASLKQYENAIGSFNKAIYIEDEYAEAYWNKSLVQLLLGDFENGWTNYEYRWLHENADSRYHQDIASLTSIANIRSKKILVWSEQGFGDVIQFARYILLLSQMGAVVIFEVHIALKDLMHQSLPGVQVITGDEIVENIDFQIPILSLPKLFSTTLDSIRFSDKYLSSSGNSKKNWKEKLKIDYSKFNIGIACSGNKAFRGRSRSINLDALEPLFNMANVYLIQKDIEESDNKFVSNYDNLNFVGENINTFGDSAAIVDQMDLVITIDTSLAHLAGALGKKTFLMLTWTADWRWLVERSDSPWYSSLKLFRQHQNKDWSNVILDVISETRQCIAQNEK